MRIEVKYREGLKQLMKSMPLDEINVVMLAKSINSNRQTFYYHFRDISDVLEAIFLKEKIGANKRVIDFDSIIKPLIAYINANESFLKSVANSFASEKVEQFFYSYFYQKSFEYIKNQHSENILNKANYVSRYIAAIFSKEMIYYLQDPSKEKSSHVIKRLTPIWNYLTDQYLHNKTIK